MPENIAIFENKLEMPVGMASMAEALSNIPEKLLKLYLKTMFWKFTRLMFGIRIRQKKALGLWKCRFMGIRYQQYQPTLRRCRISQTLLLVNIANKFEEIKKKAYF